LLNIYELKISPVISSHVRDPRFSSESKVSGSGCEKIMMKNLEREFSGAATVLETTRFNVRRIAF